MSNKKRTSKKTDSHSKQVLSEIKQAIKDNKTWELYEEYEDDNYNSELVVLYASTVGSKDDVAKAIEIFEEHRAEEYLSDKLSEERSKLSKKLWPLFFKNAQAKETVKLAKGGVVDSDWGSQDDFEELYANFPDDHTEATRIWSQLSQSQKDAFIHDLDVTDAASEHISDSWLEFVNAKSEEDWMKNCTNWDEYAKGGNAHKRVRIIRGYRMPHGYKVVKGSDKNKVYSKGKRGVQVDAGWRMPKGYGIVDGAYNMKYEHGATIQGEGKNVYKAFYKGKETDLRADSSYSAQTKAAAFFKAKKSYDVTVVILAKGDDAVIHSTSSFGEGATIDANAIQLKINEYKDLEKKYVAKFNPQHLNSYIAPRIFTYPILNGKAIKFNVIDDEGNFHYSEEQFDERISDFKKDLNGEKYENGATIYGAHFAYIVSFKENKDEQQVFSEQKIFSKLIFEGEAEMVVDLKKLGANESLDKISDQVSYHSIKKVIFHCECNEAEEFDEVSDLTLPEGGYFEDLGNAGDWYFWITKDGEMCYNSVNGELVVKRASDEFEEQMDYVGGEDELRDFISRVLTTRMNAQEFINKLNADTVNDKDVNNQVIDFVKRHTTSIKGEDVSSWASFLNQEETELACSVFNKVIKAGPWIEASNLKYGNKDVLKSTLEKSLDMFNDNGKLIATSLIAKLDKLK